MSDYKRIYLSGRYYFFTVVTANRIWLFNDDANVQRLKDAFRYIQKRKPFEITAICVLPDHLHCIWLLQDDGNHSLRWQMIKTYFSRRLRSQIPAFKDKAIWQPRYWEHVIRNQDDLDRHIDYIHYNPVKHGLVSSANSWPYSSYRKYRDQGWYEDGWGDAEPVTLKGLHFE